MVPIAMADCDWTRNPLARRPGLKASVAALLLCLVAVTSGAAAESKAQSDEPPSYSALVERAGFAAGDVGFLVVDLKDKHVVAEYNADRPFIPASGAKIATIAPALELLGGDHRFTTTLNAEGDVADGVLDGSLTLRGGGDPFLTGDDLQAMAKALAAAGIKEVKGKFLYDATAMVEVPRINGLQPEAAGYNNGVSALSLNFNRIRLYWRKDGDARSASVATVSKGLTLPLDTVAVAFAPADLPGPYVRNGPPAGDSWLLSPDLPAKGEEWLPVANSSRTTADAFRAIAAGEGIALPEPSPAAMPEGAREIVRHDSVPLTDIARAVLRYSNNLSAELIGLATSRRLTGTSLPLAESGAALAAWWRTRLPDADWTGLVLDNHSGLSSDSRATPRQIVTMLEEAAGLPDTIDFHELLKPIAWKGVKGSAHVKTGTMSYARGLAGYIDTAAGNRLAFAIFFNDAAKREALDKAFDPHVVVIDSLSRKWRNRALVLEQKLTTGWAEQF